MRRPRLIALFVFACLALHAAPLKVAAQGQMANLGQFDNRKIHFGIQVGYIQSMFDLDFSQDDELRQTLQGVTSYYTPGFNVAIMAPDLKLNRWLTLRTIPGVTLITRDVDYTWEPDYLASHPLAERRRNVESVYGDIPIELTLRAVRYGNFRPYLVAGTCYSFDIASLRKNRNRTNQMIIRLSPHDLRYSMGVGFDVFLRYVKFAIEFKTSFGLVDLKIEDPDVYIRSFEGLKSRTFMLSFIFED